ncbi:MAG: hypothetical protein ABI854_08440 [Betaproteobacteria bacterium]
MIGTERRAPAESGRDLGMARVVAIPATRVAPTWWRQQARLWKVGA